MSSTNYVRVATDKLPVGSRLGHPINDDEDRLLLAAGAPITSTIKDRLASRGITHVLLHPDDAAALLGNKGKKRLAAKRTSAPPAPVPKKVARPSRPPPGVAQLHGQIASLATSVSLELQLSGQPLRQQFTSAGCTPYDPADGRRLAQNFSKTTQLLDAMVQQALAGGLRDSRMLAWAAEDYTNELTRDADHVIASSTEIAPDPTLSERGVRLSLLAMATAVEMGWDEANVRDVGLCGLVHDWGMYRLAEHLQLPRERVSESDQAELAMHPLHTVDMLQPLEKISPAVRYAASQVHENLDGSGYPRGLTQGEIHPFAHVLHSADAYITLTATVDGRPPYMAYDVMVYLLNQVKAGRMDQQAMRALLNVVSLFPIGSHVRLSDGTEARVIRRNAQRYSTPIVQRVGADRTVRLDSKHPSIINLSETELRVMTPLEPPDRHEARMEEDLLEKILWESAVE